MKIDEDELMGKIQEFIKNKDLESICEILHDDIEHYDWVGIYMVENDDRLVLGPFEGKKTIHTNIPIGKGICGLAAARSETILVDDVSKEDEYLSCSPDVKSEIVVPIFKGERVVGEIDIDSNRECAFDQDDKRILESIAEMIGGVI